MCFEVCFQGGIIFCWKMVICSTKSNIVCPFLPLNMHLWMCLKACLDGEMEAEVTVPMPLRHLLSCIKHFWGGKFEVIYHINSNSAFSVLNFFEWKKIYLHVYSLWFIWIITLTNVSLFPCTFILLTEWEDIVNIYIWWYVQ